MTVTSLYKANAVHMYGGSQNNFPFYRNCFIFNWMCCIVLSNLFNKLSMNIVAIVCSYDIANNVEVVDDHTVWCA